MSIINTSLIGKVKKQLKGVINGDIDIAYNPSGDFDISEIEETTVAEALNQLGQESNWWSNINSSVRLYGGIIQDNGDGTVRVSSGGGLYKKNASSVEGVPAGECEPMQLNTAQGGRLYYSTWEENLNVELTNDKYNYIFIVWDHTIDNGDGTFGNTAIVASTNFYLADWENDSSYYDFKDAHPELNLPARRSGMLHAHTVGRVYKMDNEITIRVCGTNGWNFNKRVQLFGEEFFPVVRARGLAIEAAQGDLQFNVTEGVMWAEMANRFTVQGFRMDDGDTFTSWYQHTAIEYEGDLASIQSTYPTGITDNPYAIVYSTVDDKYYRYDSGWTEVLDYIESKVNVDSAADLATIQTNYTDGFYNITSDGNDYVILQLQATDEFYEFNSTSGEWKIFTGDKSTKVIVPYIGNLEGMNADHPNGFQGNIDIIVPTTDGNYYEYSGVEGEGWVRVHGYVWRSGWLRFFNQDALDVTRYNDVTNNKLVDINDDEYGVAWVYMVHDNSCHVVYGRESYTQETAAQADLPTPLPGLLAAYSTLVGKITYSKGITEFTNAKLESPFTEKFVSSGVSLHNDFAGLQGGNTSTNEYYHLDEEQYLAIDNFLNSGSEEYITTTGDDVKYGDLDLTNGAVSFTQTSETNATSVHVPMPDGGAYSTDAATKTGYLKVTLPQSWTNTMMSFDISIYDRNSTEGELVKIEVAGLTSSSSSEWTNVVARIVSGVTDKITDVKFGHDGTKCALYLGSVDTNWEYPQVTVTNFQAGFAGATSATWRDDWGIDFTTTLGTISNTKTVVSVSSHDHSNLSNLNSIDQDLGTTDDVTFVKLTADSIQLTGGGSTRYTVWHAGNDGTGSGLDADTIDGLDSTQFLRSDTDDTASGDLTFNGEIFATNPAYGGFPLAANMIHNSYMNRTNDSSVPLGWTGTGVTIEAVSPYTKGFEGRYVSTAYHDDNLNLFTEDWEEATGSSLSYWYGNYQKGPRIARGGLGDGWHSMSDGQILKISSYTGNHSYVSMPMERNNLGAKWLFSCWVKITKGAAFGGGVDSGYNGVARGTTVSKTTADAGPQGWYRYTTIATSSQITSLDNLAFSLGVTPDDNGEIEVYVALPYLTNVNYKGTNLDVWTGSVVDKLMRQGIYIHPSSSYMAINSEVDTSYRLKVDGNQYITGNLTIDGTVDGIDISDIPTDYIGAITSTDNAIVKFDGTTGQVQNTNVVIDTNTIIFNSDVTALPTLNAGIEVERGTSVNTSLFWDEVNDLWKINNSTNTYAILGEIIGDSIIEVSGNGQGPSVTLTHKDVTLNDTVSSRSLSNGQSFVVINSLTVEGKGHVTGYNTDTVTIPTYTDGTGLILIDEEFSVNFGTTTGTVAEGNHTHSQYLEQSDLDTYGKYSTTTSTTNAQVVDTFSTLEYSSGEYLITVRDTATGNVMTEKLIITTNTTTVSSTSYASLGTNLGTFSSNISGTTVEVTFTPSVTNTQIKFKRELLENF